MFEELPDKSLIDKSNASFVWAQVPTVEQRELHSVQPIGRNIQKESQLRTRRRSVNRNKAIPATAAKQWPASQSHRFDTRRCAQMLTNLIPEHQLLRSLSNRIEREDVVSGKTGWMIR